MIFHIPHSSKSIPEEVKQRILLGNSELNEELILMTDAYTDELFGEYALPEDTVVTFPISRLVVDPERFLDDDLEEMTGVGMGVIYTKTSDGRRLRDAPSREERSTLLSKYYHPHHDRLTAAARAELTREGHTLILDCHSFPSRPLPYEKDQNPERPDICIGVDSYHTPKDLAQSLQATVNDMGIACAMNRPFGGSLVPLPFYQQDGRVLSVMIEINRKLYMDETGGLKSSGFEDCRKMVGGIIATARKYNLDLQ